MLSDWMTGSGYYYCVTGNFDAEIWLQIQVLNPQGSNIPWQSFTSLHTSHEPLQHWGAALALGLQKTTCQWADWKDFCAHNQHKVVSEPLRVVVCDGRTISEVAWAPALSQVSVSSRTPKLVHTTISTQKHEKFESWSLQEGRGLWQKTAVSLTW